MLMKLMNYYRYYVNDERGQGLVEYALIIALIAVVLVVALGNVEGGRAGVFQDIVDALGGGGDA